MKIKISIGLILLLLISSTLFCQPSFKRETRGIWVSSVYNIDWPSSPNMNQNQSEEEIIKYLDEISSLGFNTIYLQIKPAWGVMYRSEKEPISTFLGEDVSYDPINFWIEQASQRNLFIHAWINPFRVLKTKNPYPIKPWLKNINETTEWLDPSYPEVTKQVIETIEEILSKYNFDGIHFDDYFYPYPSYFKESPYQDELEYQAYLANGGKKEKEDWRRENINKFIQNVSSWIRTNYPSKVLGISPFGIWKKSLAYNIKGMESYSEIYADSLLWINEGWIDYIVPQLYWSLDRPEQNYAQLASWWKDHTKPNKVILTGVMPNPIGSQRSIPEEEILEFNAINNFYEIKGMIFFNLRKVLEDPLAVEKIKIIFNGEKALPYPIKGKGKPSSPIGYLREESGEKKVVLLNQRNEWKTITLPQKYAFKEELWIFYLNESAILSQPLVLDLTK